MKVGTCGFSKSMKRHFSCLDCVEVQETFYRIIRPKTLEKWRSSAPDQFEFTLKAFQGITHPPSSPTWRRSNVQVDRGSEVGLLRPSKAVLDFWRMTVEEAKILEAKFIVIQLPPSFKEKDESWRNAEEFFDKIDREEFEIGVELRGWSEEGARRFCQKFEVIQVVDPLLNPSPYSSKSLGYFRLHGRHEGKRIIYRHRYSEEELREIWKRISANNFEECYVMFNNVWMFEDAVRFKEILNKRLEETS